MPSIDGLISGIDTTGLIKDILRFQRRPLEQMQARIGEETERRTSLLAFTAKLLSLQSRANLLVEAASFRRPSVTSSNESVLGASGGEYLLPGAYTFRVRQLATGSQQVSNGFASASDLLGAGVLSIDASGGSIDRRTDLDLLNGGQGVSRGSIRITNRAGLTREVDLSTAITIDDVIDAIDAAGLEVSASIAGSGDARPGEGLVLEDSSGGTGTLRVQEVSMGTTARDLGLLGSAAGTTLEGAAVAALGSGLQLQALNDGLGVRLQPGADLSIVQRDGATFTVDLGGAETVGDVMQAINDAAGNTAVSVAISGRRLVATDASGGAGSFSIASVGSGKAAEDLGLAASAGGGTIAGEPVLAGLDSTLLKTLRGGSGIDPGSVLITNQSGAAETIDLSGARTVSEALDLLNSNSIGVEASLNAAGDGLRLADSSAGAGLFKVEEVGGGSTASDLGILAASGVAADRIEGEDVEIQYVGENTRLSTLNGGRGVFAGSIRIHDPSGRSFTVNLGQETTVGDVLQDLNGAASAAGSDVVAAVNSSGNGIVLAATGGGGLLRVEEVGGGTTARDLNLAGTAGAATPLEIDGAFQRRIEVAATDTLESLAGRINDLGIGVTASVLNDGSPLTPFRLQLFSQRSGEAGGVIAGVSGGTSLSLRPVSRGRDAVLFYGDGPQPVVLRSATNEFREVIPGLGVTAQSVSPSPVVVTAARDLGEVEEAVQGLVDGFNEIIDEIRALTRFDPGTGERGPLLGESVLRTVERQLTEAVIRPVLGRGSGADLASQLGLRITANGRLTFDRAQLAALAASDPEAVERIFTLGRRLKADTALAEVHNGLGVAGTPAGAELRIHRRGGTSFDVDISGDLTIRDLLASIKNASGNGGTVSAAISGDGRSIVLTDATSGSSVFRVESLNGSNAAFRLGIDRSADSPGGGSITGREIDLTRDPGVARRLFDALEDLLDTEDGALQARADLFQSRIDDLKERSEARRALLEARELHLRQQFAQLEVLLGRNQNTLQRLTAALGGLQAGAPR